MNQDTCASCRYGDPVIAHESDDSPPEEGIPVLVCRRYPPTESGWREVLEDDWCGEWQAGDRDPFDARPLIEQALKAASQHTGRPYVVARSVGDKSLFVAVFGEQQPERRDWSVLKGLTALLLMAFVFVMFIVLVFSGTETQGVGP